MASVLFIIRVPYEESSKSLVNKEASTQVTREAEDKDTREKTDHQNVKEVKLENENEANISGDTNEADLTADDVETLTGPLNLPEVLENELRSLNVQGDSWTVTNDKTFHQVVFLEKTVERVEKILKRLTMVGIGKRLKSSISIVPTSVHIQPREHENATLSDNAFSTATTTNENQPLLKETEPKQSIKQQFKKSIKSRLIVEQVVEGMKSKALLTFDFVMFSILASLIAAVGLSDDNAIVLIVSMLLSPLMDPTLGGTFGTVIKNKSLRNAGLKTELCGLTISVTIGFLFGFICGALGENGTSWDSKKGIWPTQEMTSRGMTSGLWIGMLISLPSGAGVTLALLGGNTGSLVGVAISASLLLPAVNFGMLLAYSIICTIKPPELQDNGEFNNSTLNCPVFKDNSYVPTYSCNMGKEAAIMAVISLVLTIVNIICILITATIILKIKEISPKASCTNATQTFWTKDIKIARKAYETHKGNQADSLLKEWRAFQESTKVDSQDLDYIAVGEKLVNIVENVEESEDYQSVIRRAPSGAQNIHKVSRIMRRLVSLKVDSDEDIADNDEIILEKHLRTLQTYYTANQIAERNKLPHFRTIFSEPEPEPEIKPEKTVREFHVVETENPHHTSVVRVHAPTDGSKRYSVTTESGV